MIILNSKSLNVNCCNRIITLFIEYGILIFTVLEVSFWALTTVVKLPWKFLTLIVAVLLPFLKKVGHVFPPAPSLLYNYQFAIVIRELVGRCYPSFTTYRPTHPLEYHISIPSSISLGDIGVQKLNKSGGCLNLRRP